jgi:hypothetical protein
MDARRYGGAYRGGAGTAVGESGRLDSGMAAHALCSLAAGGCTTFALKFNAGTKGRTNIYLVLLDYSENLAEPYGVYVGMSKYAPAQRFDQHKAGIRAAGSVLKRGLEVLTGPTLHLQFIKRAEAERIEGELAEALAPVVTVVKGGH